MKDASSASVRSTAVPDFTFFRGSGKFSRMAKMKTALIVVILVFAGCVQGQQADQWKGLVLDVTTPEQAIALMGKPAKDETSPIIDLDVGRLLTPKADLPTFRALSFGADKDLPELSLYFSTSGKLLMISATPKSMPASEMEKTFGSNWRLGSDDAASDFENWDQNPSAPKQAAADKGMDMGYKILARTPKALMIATMIATPELMNSKSGFPQIAPGKPLWGNVLFLTMISRTLERQPGEPEANDRPTPKGKAPVLAPGSSITATTSAGTITIKAGQGLLRSYTWEGATRSVEMGAEGPNSDLGYPGPGNHWKPHNGIARGVLTEGTRNFRTAAAAMRFINEINRSGSCVYSSDGLVVCFSKVLPRQQLNVDVWGILINGKNSAGLKGSSDDKISYKP